MALAVDAGIDDAEGAAVLAAAAALGRDEIALVYTHGHIDHALGGTAFSGRTIHARREVGDYMRSQLAAWAERGGETSEQLAARLGWPTDRFEHETVLDLGGRCVRLIDSPGHAAGAICVFDPEAGVLFGGDTIVTAIPPAFSDGDGAMLERTLRYLATLDAEILIPGHGDVVSGRAAVREAIEWSADYLASLPRPRRAPGLDRARWSSSRRRRTTTTSVTGCRATASAWSGATSRPCGRMLRQCRSVGRAHPLDTSRPVRYVSPRRGIAPRQRNAGSSRKGALRSGPRR